MEPRESKSIYAHTGWLASYEESEQTKALILCQEKKIIQLTALIETIKAEIELFENPKEISAEQTLHSIKALTENIPEVSHTEGFFKWIG